MTLRALLLAAALTTTAAFAQEFRMSCNDNNWNDDRSFKECAIKDLTLPGRTQLNVDALRNGGIAVRGYDGADIKVRAKLEAWAGTAAEAKTLLSRLQLATSGPVISATGGDNPLADHQGYAVSFEMYVPRRIDVDLTSHNGPISLKGIEGRLRFKTHNGPLDVQDLAGDVEGSTHNGPIHAVLSGNTWRGQKLDLSTYNGPLAVKLPPNYSAQFESSRNWGPLSLNYPLTNKSGDKKQIVATLGSGGPLVRITTKNGPVSISETSGH